MNNRHAEMRPLAGKWEHLTRPGWPEDKTPVWKRFTLVVPENLRTQRGPPGVMFEWHENGRITGYLYVDVVKQWLKSRDPERARRVN